MSGVDSISSTVNDFGLALTGAALRHGFDLAGVLDLDAAMPALAEHSGRFGEWIDAGRHGEMEYLPRGAARRADPRALRPEARGVLCVAMAYGPVAEPLSGDDARYARYLRGRDYHRVLPERLEAALGEVRAGHDFTWKICCDTSAVLERSLAHLAGLGWIGKNTCLIHPRLGSYLFLAEAFVSRETGGAPSAMPDHCGSCNRCLVACPTGAFPAAGVLDARRCLSYWTLEKRSGPDAESGDIDAVRGWVAGCDICQEVCPFNRKPSPSRDDAWLDAAADATATARWEDLVVEPETAYAARVAASALSWVRPAHFRRNVALALASRADALDANRRGVLAELVATARDAETDVNTRRAWESCETRLRNADQREK
ncbi:MAG: tRNA epoxyqueuosine(34) reductase QueG [Deltaproteobacteria bacterium]|nr:tRNA epoxyqueuosine(34) reductase QueG [Deltaproteobacteria bacterium]